MKVKRALTYLYFSYNPHTHSNIQTYHGTVVDYIQLPNIQLPFGVIKVYY